MKLEVKKGSVVLQHGPGVEDVNPLSALQFRIDSGKVLFICEGESLLLQSGDWFGLEMLVSTPRDMQWVAHTDAVLSPVKFRHLSNYPELLMEWAQSMARQKKFLLQDLLRSNLPGSKRVELALQDMASEGLPLEVQFRTAGKKPRQGIYLQRVNRNELARTARVGREYVSRHLRKLCDAGVLRLVNKGVVILGDLK